MELILINSSKLKIMLNENDMKEYSIGSDSDCVEPGVRKAIRSLLERARDQGGFNTEGDEIFVQLYASKKGGCELFVTKTGDTEAKESEEKAIKSAKKLLRDVSNSLPARIEHPEGGKSLPIPKGKDSLTFSFDAAEHLLKACRILAAQGDRYGDVKSSAMTDGNGSYYLTLQGVGMSAFSRLDRLTFLWEFGKKEDTERIDSYISEYGRVICRNNAIETLGALC